MRLILCLFAALAALAGCTVSAPYADDVTVASVSYSDPGPKEIKLLTMINNRTGEGGHSALVINGPERIFFDPAGSFAWDPVPERNDVLFGITPQVYATYLSAHARDTHHVLIQTIRLSPEQARAAYNAALNWGPVAAAFCTQATSGVLAQIPGFEGIEPTFYPHRLAEQVGRLPGVETERYYENHDPVDIKDAVARLQQG